MTPDRLVEMIASDRADLARLARLYGADAPKSLVAEIERRISRCERQLRKLMAGRAPANLSDNAWF